MSQSPGNLLCYGDNLAMLRDHIADARVDLVYLDPPFNSDANYNMLFKERDGSQAAAQIQAFEDTWRWDAGAARAFDETVEKGGKVAAALVALRTLVGDSDMLAYLSMMAPRLVELHRVLKPTGSLYLHCDPTASHYLKLLLDAVFGAASFRNEIIWKRTTAHSSAKKYAPVHDVLMYYAKGSRPTWNQPRTAYDQAYLDRYYRFDDGDGRLYWRADITGAGRRNGETGAVWRGFDVTAKGRHWAYPPSELDEMDRKGRIYWAKGGSGWPQEKRYRDDLKGKAVSDVWDDIDRINPVGSERLGYPTQKPEALLDRIINASTTSGDVVLDPFCGCGTAVASAQRLGRQWIGIDITVLAIRLIRQRLSDAHGSNAKYEMIGAPPNANEAAHLAKEKPIAFQDWVVTDLLGGRRGVRGADRGIDGIIEFRNAKGTKIHRIMVSVKAGKVQSSHLRDLSGVVTRENAAIGVLVSMEEPTRAMRVEAASGGFFESDWGKHPRLQLLTVEDLFAGKQIDYPHITGGDATFKKAPKAKAQPRSFHQDLFAKDPLAGTPLSRQRVPNLPTSVGAARKPRTRRSPGRKKT